MECVIMPKYYTDTKGRKFALIQKKINCTTLYLYADLFDDLKVVLEPLVDKKTKKMLLELSNAIHEQIPHLQCDNITDCYIVEEGYNYK